ncbi:DUF3450 domain-containing protein [Ferrimonas lipolytica]|uniref:DUF3450 domain-containing protein n=1 Tax=Ferrimonas lipolytica TaxID=2724191 RepID=A0A6H1UHC2_9GAMM|nr:DUF3450 domain-containing protein [Ferrimonas lipolytica]QIZ77192.1 DUF3450 domain-containing protein [Ferrimonas lipolytica]
MKRTKLASTVIAALALTVSGMSVAADKLTNIQDADKQIQVDAAKSQQKVNKLYDQAQDMLFEYRLVVDETETLKHYNDYVSTLVSDQQDRIDSLQSQIDGIERTKQGVVPLMSRMIESLDQFVALDIPFQIEERTARVERLKEVMGDSDVSTSEKYRLVLDAYQIENEYGNKMNAYEGTLSLDGKEKVVDFFHLGRVVFMAQSVDQKQAWVWDNEDRSWTAMPEDSMRNVTSAIKMARRQAAPDLFRVPVKTAESAE